MKLVTVISSDEKSFNQWSVGDETNGTSIVALKVDNLTNVNKVVINLENGDVIVVTMPVTCSINEVYEKEG